MDSQPPPAKVRRVMRSLQRSDGKTFDLDSIIADDDFITNRPRDCLLEIFPFFDRADLDAISTANRVLNAIAVQFKPNAAKGMVEELRIEEVLMDGPFFQYCNEFFPIRSARRVFSQMRFDEAYANVFNVNKEIVLDWKPMEFELTSSQLDIFDPVNFFVKYDVNSVNKSSLTLRSTIDHCKHRQRIQKKGAWQIRTSHAITKTIIERGLQQAITCDNNLQYDENDGAFEISNHGQKIITIKNSFNYSTSGATKMVVSIAFD